MRTVIAGIEKESQEAREVQASKNHVNGHVAILIDDGIVKTTKTAEYTTAQTNTVFIAGVAGKKLCIREISIDSDATSGQVSLDFATSTIPVARLYLSAQKRSEFFPGHLVGAAGEGLTLNTTTSTSKVFIMVNYIVHD